MLTTLDGKAWVHIRHICGHWERHPFPEAAEPDVVEANLKAQRCARCEAKEKERADELR